MKSKNYIPALSYNFLTRYYDRIIKWVMPGGFREILVKQVNPSPDENILDFGTGTAALAMLLKKEMPGINITGIDIDPNVLRFAGTKISAENLEIQICLYDGIKFPFLNNYFNKVVSCLVFHHLSPDQKHHALSEIYRVMKSGGKIYIADWGLERNKIKAKLLHFFLYFNALKHIVEHGKGLFPQYLLKAGFQNVVESAYIKTRTGTLSYYTAEK